MLPAVFLVADIFHPIDDFAVELFVNGDMSHGSGWGGPMPMFFAWEERDHIAGVYFLDRTALALNPATAGGDDQRLPERMSMPRGAGPRLERNACAGGASWSTCLEQGIDAHRAGKPIRRSLRGWL